MSCAAGEVVVVVVVEAYLRSGFLIAKRLDLYGPDVGASHGVSEVGVICKEGL